MSEYVDTRAILKREYEFWENTVLKGVRADKTRPMFVEENKCMKCGKRVGYTAILCYACYMSPTNKINRSNAHKKVKSK